MTAVFLVPVPKSNVQAALDKNYGPGAVVLTDVPSHDTSLFPSGFPADHHPVVSIIGTTLDTRMSIFQIQDPFQSGQVQVPYVRRFDSANSSVFGASIFSVIAGENNAAIPALVPSTVSTVVEGFPSGLGQLIPGTGAWQTDQFGTLSAVANWKVVPAVSGPGVIINMLDFTFDTNQNSFSKTYTQKLYKAVLNQPAILAGASFLAGLCQRNQFYANNITSIMTGRTGNVTFGPASDVSLVGGNLDQSAPGGFYPSIAGSSACWQNVGYNPESCKTVQQNVDKSAL